jgi:methionine sulfoxide reductase heme-binding subunit
MMMEVCACFQRWRKLHALNPILYILVTLHGLMSGTDFQGTILATVNIAPIIIMGGILLSNKKKLTVAQ